MVGWKMADSDAFITVGSSINKADVWISRGNLRAGRIGADPQTAYPCHEQAGGIRVHGAGRSSVFPQLRVPDRAPGHTYAIKLFHEANYLQMNEGSFDIPHLAFLHYNYMNDGGTAARGGNGASAPDRDLCSRGAAPGLESTDADLTEYGVRNCRIRPLGDGSEYHLRINEFVLPNFIAFPGNAGTYGINWHVPIDDTHHWKWTWTFDREKPLDQETIENNAPR